MRSILLKDLYNIKQQAKIYVMITAVWAVIGIMNKDSSFFGGLIMMLTILIPITAISYDEKAKWDKYALTMPISRKDMALSKYALAFIISLGGFLLSFAAGCLIDGDVVSSLISGAVFLVLGMGIISVILPLIYKFGVEKGRIIIIALMLLPTALALLFSRLGIAEPSEEILKKIIYLLPAVCALLVTASIFISVKIYKNKEF